MHAVFGWECAVCAAKVDLLEPMPWRCPNSSPTDRHHVLQMLQTGDASVVSPGPLESTNPFARFDHRLAWSARAAARGMTSAARAALVVELDEAVRAVDGVGFVTTPFERSSELSDRLGFSSDGGVWVKDETGGVGGSQKARHLFGILLHLRSLELLGELDERPPLAIASCGNAALAAATLAKAADWPIDVYVPTWMSDGFGRRLDALGATIHRCERRDDDPPGDPAMFRFREAVDAGAVPFTVQGPENALCLDGGRTIGWELAEQIVAPTGPGDLAAVYVQVGGGAFASCLGAGLVESGRRPMLMAVQAAGCAPLDRAWRMAATPTSDWSEVMAPWPDPTSLADGILDDETYDWIGVLDAIRATGGDTVVASESNIERAHEVALDAGFDASPTGTAGLAGLLEHMASADPWLGGPNTRVAVVMSGVTR
jgi:threonine synthase